MTAKEEDLVMVIDKPHFKVKLHKTLLEVDIKKGIRKELEDALESKPKIRESLGLLFQTMIPLDIPLKDIESVNVDNKGRIKIVTPLRKDIVIPLKPSESKPLVEKLNELIPIEKERALKELQAEKMAEVEEERQRAKAYTAKKGEMIR